jgi:hypothetical protein
MPNGKIGDHPITDLLVHGLHPFPQEIEDLILEIRRRDPDATFHEFGVKPMDWQRGEGLDEARRILRQKLDALR